MNNLELIMVRHKKTARSEQGGFCEISRKCFLVSTAEDLNSSHLELIVIGVGINPWQVGLKIGTAKQGEEFLDSSKFNEKEKSS